MKVRKSGGGNPYLAALMNPFDIQGAKIPDLGVFPSGTASYYSRQLVNLTTNPYAFVFQPSPNNEQSVTSNLGTVTWGAWTASQQNAQFQALFHSYRVVSGGLRVRYMGPTLSDQGMLCACLLPKQEGFSASIAAIADIQNRPQSVCTRLGDGLEFLWSPQDVDDYIYYITGSSSITGLTRLPSICLGISGQNANAPVMIEWFYNLEVIPETRIVSYVHTTASPSNPSWLAQAETFMSSVGNSLGHALNDQQSLVSQALKHLPSLTGQAIAAGVRYAYSRPSTRFIEYPVD